MYLASISVISMSFNACNCAYYASYIIIMYNKCTKLKLQMT